MSCPTCAGAVPLTSHGRPPIYCSIDCRREMTRRRRRVDDLEEELVAARVHAADDFWPGREGWERRIVFIQRYLEEARQLVPEEFQ